MNPLITIELALRIWLRILETTPDDVLAQQNREAWENFKRVVGWMEKMVEWFEKLDDKEPA
jgi:hypothetical protein